MIENLNDNNQIILIGKIADECTLSHELYNEKFYNFKLECERSSGNVDTLPITISERLINVKNLQKDLMVKINGQIRSYNTETKNNSKLQLIVFVKDIELFDNDENDIEHRNEVYLNGFICKKPEYRETPRGRSICDLNLAINRAYYKSDYIPVIAWGRNAKYSGDQVVIGDNLELWGRFQSREYVKKLSNDTVIKKIAYEVSIIKMDIHKDNNNKE
ncbi:MAG: single-stranded DNA-binding protein [archaeon]